MAFLITSFESSINLKQDATNHCNTTCSSNSIKLIKPELSKYAPMLLIQRKGFLELKCFKKLKLT